MVETAGLGLTIAVEEGPIGRPPETSPQNIFSPNLLPDHLPTLRKHRRRLTHQLPCHHPGPLLIAIRRELNAINGKPARVESPKVHTDPTAAIRKFHDRSTVGDDRFVMPGQIGIVRLALHDREWVGRHQHDLLRAQPDLFEQGFVGLNEFRETPLALHRLHLSESGDRHGGSDATQRFRLGSKVPRALP